jgi:hypothetical protein
VPTLELPSNTTAGESETIKTKSLPTVRKAWALEVPRVATIVLP